MSDDMTGFEKMHAGLQDVFGAFGVSFCNPPIQLEYGKHIFVGDRCLINSNARFMDGADTRIGAGAIILGGVTIGDGSVIGAGSVVTRSVPARVVAAGNPARSVRILPEAS